MVFGSRNCGHCSGIQTIVKTVSNNYLEKRCCDCGYNLRINLITIKKKLIYLDQNFFSHAHRNKLSRLSALLDRLTDLADKQLLVCPYSDTHDKESHLLHDNDALWDFIKKTSRGNRFYLQNKIKRQQIINAYIAFINNETDTKKLVLNDAIEGSIHDWDDSFRIELPWTITKFLKPAQIRNSKEHFSENIYKILPQWRSSTSTIEQDFNLELRDYAKIMLDEFRQLLSSQDIPKVLESENYSTISILLSIDEKTKSVNEGLQDIIAFFESNHFANIPFINISAGLWAIIKHEIKKSRFITTSNIEKIKEKVRGIPYDIEHLSIYAPYCDVIFTEKNMSRWLSTWLKNPLARCHFKVYSKSTIDEFNAYLDEVESDMSDGMKEELEMVFGD